MAALRRILLCFWGLLCAAVAAFMVVMLVNGSAAQNIYDFLDKCFLYNFRLSFLEDTGIWWVVLFGVILLIVAVFCIIIALAPKRAAKNLRVPTVDGGSLDISLAALQHIVNNAAAAQKGVDQVDTRLSVKNNGLYIQINLKVPDNISVTETGAIVRAAVLEQLEATTSIIPADIQIVVAAVTAEKKEAVAYGN